MSAPTQDASVGQLDGLLAGFERVVGGLHPELVSGSEAARLVGVFAKVERLAGAGRTLMARRAAEADVWRAEGYRSAEEWLAARTHSSTSAAVTTLAVGRRLDDLSGTADAYRSGKLSDAQAAAITSAATADRHAESRLLAEADRSSLKGLQKSCQAVQAAASRTQIADRNEIHRTRYLRHWTAPDGAFEGRFRMTADHGAVLLAAIDSEHAAVFARARADGRYESAAAYDVDSLIALARRPFDASCTGPASDRTTGGEPTTGPPCEEGDDRRIDGSGGDPEDQTPPEGRMGDDESGEPGATGPSPGQGRTGDDESGEPGATGPSPGRTGPTAVVNIRVDHTALLRGHTEPGEVCEITGIGPVPVATARRALSDAYLRVLIVDGDRVIDTRTAGRTISTRLRTALEERDRTCAVPGCDTARHLEIHHLDPIAHGGQTSLDNTCRICSHHHDQITYEGAHLDGMAPHWHWHPPGARPTHARPPKGGPNTAGTMLPLEAMDLECTGSGRDATAGPAES